MAKWVIDREVLAGLYWDSKKSLTDIGKLYGVHAQTVHNRMSELDIPRRSCSESLIGRDVYWHEKISEAMKGKVLSEERRLKISEAKKGGSPWNKGKRKATHPELANTGSPGEMHWAWNGGISGENARLRQTSEYKAWRDAVFRRDLWTCQSCGQKGGDLEADHLKWFAHYPELRFSIDNGRTLCKPCHKQITKEQQTWQRLQSN